MDSDIVVVFIPYETQSLTCLHGLRYSGFVHPFETQFLTFLHGLRYSCWSSCIKHLPQGISVSLKNVQFTQNKVSIHTSFTTPHVHSFLSLKRHLYVSSRTLDSQLPTSIRLHSTNVSPIPDYYAILINCVLYLNLYILPRLFFKQRIAHTTV